MVELKRVSIIRSIFFCFIFFLCGRMCAQSSFGNEWIVEGQKYYKIKVWKNGLYKIDGSAVSSLGKPAEAEIWYRGEQIPIQTKAAGSSFTTGDYILFYGQKNDGVLDTPLYFNPQNQTHRDVSMYSDTSVYFLTFSSSGSKERIRISAPQKTTSFAAATEFTEISAKYFAENYSPGIPIDARLNYYSSEYYPGEGWASDELVKGGVRVINLRTPSIIIGTQPVLDIVAYGRSDFDNSLTSGNDKRDHQTKYEIKGSGNSYHTLFKDRFDGFIVRQYSLGIDEKDCKDSASVRVTAMGSSDTNNATVDRISLGYIKITYQRSFNYPLFSPFVLSYTNTLSDSQTHFAFSGFPAVRQPLLYIYDKTNSILSTSFYTTGLAHFTITNTGGKADYYVQDDSSIQTVGVSAAFTYTFPDPSVGYNYLIITNRQLSNSVSQYASYRGSTKMDTATNFKPYTAYVDELYDIFYYGIHHPLAIQHYCAYMYKKSTSKPKYLFLIGKCREVETLRDNKGFYYSQDLVPTIGVPPADLQFTTGLDNDFKGYDYTLNPYLAVGRLPATSDNDVLVYLDKVKQYESTGAELWKKNIMHIAGGGDPSTQNEILQHFDINRLQVENPFVGGNIWLFKGNTSKQDLSGVAQISSHINNGASLLTYYGHGSANVIGVDIGDPLKDYTNAGKYPIMYLNGCNVGNPAISSSVAEKQIFAPQRGTVLWISHSTSTVVSTLAGQIKHFYDHMCVKNYPSDMGTIWRETMTDYERDKDYDLLTKNIYMTWIYMGDPGLKSLWQPLNDYAIYDSTISLFPVNAIANDDSFALKIIVYNLGKASSLDTVQVQVSRKYPDGHLETYPIKKFNPVYYRGEMIYWMKNNKSFIASGINNFSVTIDPDNVIKEVTKTNNTISKDLYLPGNGARQIYPNNFGIVPVNNPVLVAQSRNIYDTLIGIYIEVDTNLTFHTPALLKSPILKGNIVYWQPNLLTKDTCVYYWRCKLADTSKIWEESNFTYIKNSPDGWSQSHWQQYKTITSADMKIDTNARYFDFGKYYSELSITTHPYYSSNLGIKPQSVQILTAKVDTRANLVAVEFDQNTLVQYIPPSSLRNGKGYKGTDGSLRAYRMFNMNNKISPSAPKDSLLLGQDSFINWVSRIRPGNYLSIMTYKGSGGAFFTKYSDTVINAFHSLGSTMIDTLHNDTMYDKGTAYVFLGRKGGGNVKGSEAYKKYYSTAFTNNELSIKPLMEGKSTQGSITSMKIGPASKWVQAIQVYTAKEFPTWDSAKMVINGYDTLSGLEKIDSFKGNKNISAISAKQYPYLSVTSVQKDTVMRTPPQLRNWQVLFDGIAEGSLLMDKTFSFQNTTLTFGDSLKLSIGFKNVSKYAFAKPVLVKIFITDKNNITKVVHNKRYKTLQPGDTFNIKFYSISNSYIGNNRLQVSVNPDNDQPEVSLENNIISIPFKVTGDVQNPILDVTFDGRHISDNEIVSAKPVIVISNKDENKILKLTDSTLITAALKRPGSSIADTLKFSSGELSFFPAGGAENKCRLEFRPNYLADGTYELIAQAKDVFGNKAGQHEYRIHFKVINQSMVSNFYVYPNPFTTKAHFVFTLTGSEIPAYMKVQILTATGRVVREINREELGNLRIGDNVTEYAWDGTDMYGDKLANGLYLYRVVVKDAAGNSIENFKTKGDKYFSHDFGKMYLMR